MSIVRHHFRLTCIALLLALTVVYVPLVAGMRDERIQTITIAYMAVVVTLVAAEWLARKPR